jgi:hypothetical protein
MKYYEMQGSAPQHGYDKYQYRTIISLSSLNLYNLAHRGEPTCTSDCADVHRPQTPISMNSCLVL